MLLVLTKALSFIAIIVIGYLMKWHGMVGKEDYKVLSKVILNLTLPAAVISSFASFQMDYSLFVVLGIGLICNILMIMLALLITKRDTAAAKLFYIFNVTGYNIGCFTLPFVQSFLGPMAVIGICMFDVGNSIMCTGMTYALAASVIGDAEGKREKFTLQSVITRLKGSVPFLIYVSMVILSVLEIKLPSSLYVFMDILAKANPFLCMLMIGMMFELNLDRRSLNHIKGVWLARYVCGIGLAALCYFCGPFSMEINKVMAAAFLAPAPIIGLIFLENLKGNVTLSGVANSVTIVTSVLLLTAFFTLTS